MSPSIIFCVSEIVSVGQLNIYVELAKVIQFFP